MIINHVLIRVYRGGRYTTPTPLLYFEDPAREPTHAHHSVVVANMVTATSAQVTLTHSVFHSVLFLVRSVSCPPTSDVSSGSDIAKADEAQTLKPWPQ
jgi:hypothetical protein